MYSSSSTLLRISASFYEYDPFKFVDYATPARCPALSTFTHSQHSLAGVASFKISNQLLLTGGLLPSARCNQLTSAAGQVPSSTFKQRNLNTFCKMIGYEKARKLIIAFVYIIVNLIICRHFYAAFTKPALNQHQFLFHVILLLYMSIGFLSRERRRAEPRRLFHGNNFLIILFFILVCGSAICIPTLSESHVLSQSEK